MDDIKAHKKKKTNNNYKQQQQKLQDEYLFIYSGYGIHDYLWPFR